MSNDDPDGFHQAIHDEATSAPAPTVTEGFIEQIIEGLNQKYFAGSDEKIYVSTTVCSTAGDVGRQRVVIINTETMQEVESICDLPTPSPTVTIPRDQWERMRAESEAWKMVRHASEHCSSNVIIYEVRDQITRLDSLTQPHATEGK